MSLFEDNIKVNMSLFSDSIIVSYLPEKSNRFVVWYKNDFDFLYQ